MYILYFHIYIYIIFPPCVFSFGALAAKLGAEPPISNFEWGNVKKCIAKTHKN